MRELDAVDKGAAIPYGPVFVIAAGKAAHRMAAAAAERLARQLRGGLVVSPAAAAGPDGFESITAGHPVPDEGSEEAGRRALEIAESLGADQLLLVLLSGGASALMAVPADGVTLADKRAATTVLLRGGADIHALNTVRKHLSAIKGGWLAVRAPGACHTLAISDVVGDDVSVIASGPTVADGTTFADARRLLDRFGGAAAFPAPVVERLERGVSGKVPETPKPGDPRLSRASIRVIGSRRDAMSGAASEAAALGYEVIRFDDPVIGDARSSAVAHMRAVLAQAADVGGPACFVSSGETTVNVTGHGKGGRNQEFALAAAGLISGTAVGATAVRHLPASARCALASIGTDGIDGPTDAAGAIADSTTLDRARAAGLSPERFLEDNNAYAFFSALGDLIHTGPTGTNVGDLQVILLA